MWADREHIATGMFNIGPSAVRKTIIFIHSGSVSVSDAEHWALVLGWGTTVLQPIYPASTVRFPYMALLAVWAWVPLSPDFVARGDSIA